MAEGFGVKPYYDEDGITIYHGDCREAASLAIDVDVVVTDPPYRSLDIDVIRGTTTRLVGRGNSAPRRASKVGMAHEDNWFATMADPELRELLSNIFDALPGRAAMYVFADVKTGLALFPSLPQKNVIVWDKLSIGMGYSWRRMHEWIAYCPKSDHKLRNLGLGDIVRSASPDEKRHPTEKPIGAVSPLILNSSDESGVVLDPFMGSGTTLVAAKNLGRKAIGIEIEERYCEIAVKRLAQRTLDLSA